MISSNVITFIAPINALMKVLPIITHIKVIALIPFNTLNSGYLYLFIICQVFWIENPLCHEFVFFLREAPKTNKMLRIMIKRVRKKVQS